MPDDDRAALEARIVNRARALTAESEQIGREFAGRHDLAANDFRALLHIMVGQTAGTPLTAGELRDRMGLSGAAITYLVERMIASGHVRRDTDPGDRRKVILRVADHGMAVAKGFFGPLARHTHRAMADLTDDDLIAADRAFAALIGAMSDFRGEFDGPSLSSG
ncbi:MAG: MarR family transcriptional regulator [Actinobacteria bacterium]|nr:MarR family transcriptional regulator [Actinomycetota bacterium]